MTAPGGSPSFSRTATGIAFWIHVSPRSKRAGVGGSYGGALRVAAGEPPVYDRWQLEEEGGRPALAEAPARAPLPAMAVPALFGAVADGAAGGGEGDEGDAPF